MKEENSVGGAKLPMGTKIVREKIDDDHKDSLWYDGLIAYTDHFELIAMGEIRIHKLDKDGNHIGMYDGKSRDDFGEIKDDKDIERIWQSEEYDVSMNNWFEIMPKDGSFESDVAFEYDEALTSLIESERSFQNENNS